MTKMIFQRSVLALFVVLLSGIQTAVSQGVTVDDIARMQTVTSSLISEDGKYIAYTLSVPADPVKENLPATNHLYVLNTQTGISKPYYTTASVSQLAFRPQKNTLTFVSRKSGENTNGIFELDLTGGEAVKIFSFTSNISSYNWHPNGNKIAFNTLERGTAPVSNLAYKPDLYEENIGERKAYIVDVTHPTNVQPILAEGSVYRHVWSPDGSKLAISVTPTASVDDSYMKQAVKIVDATSGKIIASVNNQGKLSSIHWSPDGSRLALLAAKDIHDPIDGSILIVSAQGGTPQIIDADVAGKYEQIYWTDNQTISYRMSESTSSS